MTSKDLNEDRKKTLTLSIKFSRNVLVVILLVIALIAGFLFALFFSNQKSALTQKIAKVFVEQNEEKTTDQRSRLNKETLEEESLVSQVIPPSGCLEIDLSTGNNLYEYTQALHECSNYQSLINPSSLSVKCQASWGFWRRIWVKAIDVSKVNSLQVKANLGLNDYAHLFSECNGIGVKYDDYVDLLILSSDPNPKLQLECNRIASETDWPKCNLDNAQLSVLGHCGVSKCATSKSCNFAINTKGQKKIYLAFRVADAWDYADVEGSLSGLQICNQTNLEDQSVQELPISETEKILVVARKFVSANSATGVAFDLKIVNRIGNYALVQVIPRQPMEGAGVILEKINGQWQVQDMGTTFPDWEAKVPELFSNW